jgi:dTDP-4-amino-4,6-dideoxygalactose transaminase
VVERNIAISLPSTGDDEWNAVREPLLSGWLTQGPKVAEFEKKFASYHEANHALATTSCTTGLHLILAALGIGPGDEVIVPAFTWVSTANVVLYCGATPVFADIDPHTFNINPADIAHRVTSRTKAVMVVHLFGLCADMDAIRAVVPAHIPILEDCACAAGATYKGKFAGTLGLAGAFSFHPRKSITTGEGGMVTTNDSAYAEICDQLRNHGASVSEEIRHKGPKPYLLPDFNLLGFNYRMTDLQGAVGVVQMEKLSSFIKERQQWADFYCEELADVNWLRMPSRPTEGQHAWQSFVTHVDPASAPEPRNDIMEKLQQQGISTRPGTHAVHMLNFYSQKYDLKPHDYPGAQDANDNSMSIPLHNRMSADDYKYVVRVIKTL